MNTEQTNNNPVTDEELTDMQTNVVKDLCYVAWVAQACSRIRGNVTKEQALKMVEDYFDGGQNAEPKMKHPKAATKKENPERDKFMSWVREQIKEKEDRELTIKEVAQFRGKFDYYNRFGPEAPYENAFKVKENKGKIGRKRSSGFKACLEEHERVKGAPLTEKELTWLRNKWYSTYRYMENPPVWDNRGVWPACALRACEDGTTLITVNVNGTIPVLWKEFIDINKAQETLKQLDEWMISQREGRTPYEVYEEVLLYRDDKFK